MIRAPWVIGLLMLAPMAGAQVALPLDGYYHLGKYFPVRFTIDGHRGTQLVIGSAGGLQTRIAISTDHATGIAPALMLEQSPSLPWGLSSDNGSPPLRPPLKLLSPQQRLVGIQSGDAAQLQGLFPDRDLVPVRLDAADPLPGPTAAWGTLDAILLDSPATLTPAKISTLLASGTTIAVQSAQAPDSTWPWQHIGALWVLRHDICGPRWGGENAYPFSTVAGWQAEWPSSFRLRIFLYAAIFSILCMGLALVRFRWGAAAVLLLAGAAVGMMAWWWHGRSAVLERVAMAVVEADKLTQTDAWSFRTSVSHAEARNAWDAVTWPLFEQSDWRYFKVILDCGPSGDPDRFNFQCPPGIKIGFLSRVVSPTRPAGAAQPIAPLSALGYLASPTYRRPNCQVVGSLNQGGDQSGPEREWLGTVLIRCRPAGD